MFTLGLIALLATVQPAPKADRPTPPYILVHVTDGVRELPGSHVFILGQNGEVLSEAMTDDAGEAKLKPVAEASKPAFLLAEHAWHSIGGYRWIYGAFEYCVDLVPLHSCDYTTVNSK